MEGLPWAPTLLNILNRCSGDRETAPCGKWLQRETSVMPLHIIIWQYLFFIISGFSFFTFYNLYLFADILLYVQTQAQQSLFDIYKWTHTHSHSHSLTHTPTNSTPKGQGYHGDMKAVQCLCTWKCFGQDEKKTQRGFLQSLSEIFKNFTSSSFL